MLAYRTAVDKRMARKFNLRTESFGGFFNRRLCLCWNGDDLQVLESFTDTDEKYDIAGLVGVSLKLS
jgi:hypothetical protein